MDWTRIYAYDIETYPNAFTCCIVHIHTGTRWIFEVSDRMNQSVEFCQFIFRLRSARARMLGFNNEHFDYPVIHAMLEIALYVAERGGYFTAADAYAKAQLIFNADRNDWSHNIWESDRIVPQIDLFKVMHFDNVAKSTSLKKLEINMRSESVVDLPYAPGSYLAPNEIDTLIAYMCHDVAETIKFARAIEDQLAFRDTLTARYGRDYTNFNDTKIGKQHFIDQLEAQGVECYVKGPTGKREPKQTPRYEGIHVAEKLIAVPFATPDLQRMWNYFNAAVIPAHKTKGFFLDLFCYLGTFRLDFGSGGIHGSVNSRTYDATDTHGIYDVDVTSYYPSLAIVNRFYPEHLGSAFCDIYADLKQQRVGYAKGTAENAMLKLALNGVYGDSNNVHSPFYDPAYTMAITINGQLQLAWLAELTLMYVPGAELIQINTDGLTIWAPRTSEAALEQVKQYWQQATCLDLEQVEYRRMAVRDVNNYIAIDKKGKVKRKSAYVTAPEWHQDRSSLVIPKAVSEFIENGTDVKSYIYECSDMFEFMRHIKVPRSGRLEWGSQVIQNTSRYFISYQGEYLTKVLPPYPGNDSERRFAVDKGWTVVPCNHVAGFSWSNLNRDFYVMEAKKLVAGLGVTC